MNTEEDPILDPLRELKAHDLDPATAESIRKRAGLAFAHEAALASRPVLASLERLYTRVLEPAFVAVVLVVYLSWAAMRVFSPAPRGKATPGNSRSVALVAQASAKCAHFSACARRAPSCHSFATPSSKVHAACRSGRSRHVRRFEVPKG